MEAAASQTPTVIRVRMVDHDPIVLTGICGALSETAPDLHVVVVCSSVAELLAGPGALAHPPLADQSLSSRLRGRQTEIRQRVSYGPTYRSVPRSMTIFESTAREHLSCAIEVDRRRGIEPGNSHGLRRIAREGPLAA